MKDVKTMKDINVGDKIRLTKDMGMLSSKGEEFEITSKDETIIGFKNGRGYGGMTIEEIKVYFERVCPTPISTEVMRRGEALKVIVSGKTTIVILEDGTKGRSKCHEEDSFNKELGFDIAYTRATIRSLEKKLKRMIK
ncbi:MAG: hypothetical protein RSF67_05665 [Clostridia bacterium]